MSVVEEIIKGMNDEELSEVLNYNLEGRQKINEKIDFLTEQRDTLSHNILIIYQEIIEREVED